jgi:acetoin utilization deacetylase AcuC-like enzyme
MEVPRRLEVIVESLRQQGLWETLTPVAFSRATPRQLCWVHTREYVQAVAQQCREGRATLTTGDTDICPESFDVAALAAGGCMAAVKEVMTGQLRSAFCLVRPPGHHATSGRGMGFCIFNNTALAAEQARRVHKAHRVLILDWDLHHGNGTQEIFYEDGGVFFCSLHQDGEYPMPEEQTGHRRETGAGQGEGTNLNCPLPPGSGDEQALAELHDRLLPAMRDYRPEIVIVSCGFDCRKDDPLGKLELTDEGIVEMTRVAQRIANEYAGGRIVSIIEGGYNLSTLGPAACAHVRELQSVGSRE